MKPDAASVASSTEPRRYVELWERADAVSGDGVYRWMVYDSASHENDYRYRWFTDEIEARSVLASLEGSNADA